MRRKVVFFVSYARANKRIAAKFVGEFKDQVGPSLKYHYILWQDTDIVSGEKWLEEIQEALKKCDLGLLLVSPAFLASQFIAEHELPKFIGLDAKPIIPVMLQSVNFERHNLKGLRRHQIFRLESDRFQSPKSFGNCTVNQRNRFVQALFQQVERMLDKLYGG